MQTSFTSLQILARAALSATDAQIGRAKVFLKDPPYRGQTRASLAQEVPLSHIFMSSFFIFVVDICLEAERHNFSLFKLSCRFGGRGIFPINQLVKHEVYAFLYGHVWVEYEG